MIRCVLFLSDKNPSGLYLSKIFLTDKMTDKINQEIKNHIKQIVERFYIKATGDFLIGHQFRKIQKHTPEQGPSHPLRPPIEAFRHHLPRIEIFWQIQFGLPLAQKLELPFDIIGIHRRLRIRRGELGRWILLFEETLNEYEKEYGESVQELIVLWRQKLVFFQQAFLGHPKLFTHADGD